MSSEQSTQTESEVIAFGPLFRKVKSINFKCIGRSEILMHLDLIQASVQADLALSDNIYLAHLPATTQATPGLCDRITPQICSPPAPAISSSSVFFKPQL